MRTEASQRDDNEEEEYKEIMTMGHKNGENRLAQSERVMRTSKSTTYYNYLNNRMSVKIQYDKNKPSLASRLLGTSYRDNKNTTALDKEESENNLLDLENPLLGNH